MRKKFIYCFFTLFAVNAILIGCKKDLAIKPNNLLLDEDVYTDKNLINSTLATFYNQINGPNGAGQNGWGQNNDSWNKMQQDPDDVVNNNGGPSTGNLIWGRDRYRAMDYGLIRRMNQFLIGIRSDASKNAMTLSENANFEAQVLFLRAYTYFWMTRTLGGMTIVQDRVFEYENGTDIVPYRLPRNSEEECYNYIIAQCNLAAQRFDYAVAQSNNNSVYGTAKTLNSAIANKWCALILKARAALAAASIAKYTPLRSPGSVKTDAAGTSVVGIPAAKANDFYATALATAQEIINTSPYVLQVNAANPELAFYQATTVKANNTEVIWATDRKFPSPNITWTRDNAPISQGHTDGQNEGNSLGATLNLVEAFENKDGSDPKIKDRNPDGTYVIYNDVEAPFKAKDARLWGTVIWPSAVFRGTPVPLRAGELTKLTMPYTYATSAPSKTNNLAATAPNGPADVSTFYINKTGFGIRKFLDEAANTGIGPNFSDVWWPRFRIAEAYLIAAEAALESGQPAVGLPYINKLRTDRGRIQPLTLANFTFDKIVNENRVEFSMEDHRVWDLIRWRLAHIYWNGVPDDPTAQAFSLYPYRINIPGGSPENGKWVFQRARAYRRVTTPFTFGVDSYYSTISQDWVNPRNPNWVGNPSQPF